jgi:hypothetical protein
MSSGADFNELLFQSKNLTAVDVTDGVYKKKLRESLFDVCIFIVL